MKGMILLLMISAMTGCKFYAETTEPVLYLGGGKWTFAGFAIVTETNGYQMAFASGDTVCLNSPAYFRETPAGRVLRYDWDHTALDRRFVRDRTLWEFDGYNLYCHFLSGSERIIFSRRPFWVNFPDPFYNGHTLMEVADYTSEERIIFSFAANNAGVGPPDTLWLGSPELYAYPYSLDGVRGNGLAYRVFLTFTR